MQTEDSKGEALYLDEIAVPRKLNFLIVEDEADIQELMKDSLLELGFEGSITISETAEQAIELCKETVEGSGPLKQFDFLISDWNLKGVSGLDFLIEIKKISNYSDVPFMMVTANDNVSGMLVAIKKGASEYLVKPWELEELATKIALSWEKKNRP